jgi:hypothetical protein
MNRPGCVVGSEVEKFLNLLVDYTDLRKIADNELDPIDLRYDKDQERHHASMLASTTMLRVLAGVYHDLTVVDPKTKRAADGKPAMTRAAVGIFFRDLGPLMKALPVTDGSPWMDTDCFIKGGSAPPAVTARCASSPKRCATGLVRASPARLARWIRLLMNPSIRANRPLPTSSRPPSRTPGGPQTWWPPEHGHRDRERF